MTHADAALAVAADPWLGIRGRLSRVIAVAGALAIVLVGTSLYLRDGSYFLDEAAVVESLDELGAIETFTGPLAGGGQNFPRFYLLAIRAARAVFGPSTLATRLLPHLFFVLATALWMRLVFVRFRARPFVVAMAVPLFGMASSWWLYSAVVKQYSFDVFLVLALFSLPDSFFARRFRAGDGLRGLAALLVPAIFSYTYAVALVARLAGWYAFSLRGAPGDGRFRLDVRACLCAGAGLATALAVLWLTDVRHTFDQSGLFVLWRQCVVGAGYVSDWSIVDRFFFGWYTGPSEFILHPELDPRAVDGLRVAVAIGASRVAASVVFALRTDAPVAWGSRSVGCLAGVACAIATSVALDYPICAGRLSLYALFFQHVLLLEGLDQVVSWVARAGKLPWRPRQLIQLMSVAAAVGLLGATGLTAWRVGERVLANAPLEDVRPLLPRLAEAPGLPVVATNCMRRQIATLPEGVGTENVILLPAIGWEAMLPAGEEIWVFHSGLTGAICERLLLTLRSRTDGLPALTPFRREQAALFRVRVLDEAAVKAKRKRAYRALAE